MGQFNLTNEHGETTSHLQGMFYRTIRMMGNGLKPVFVFDGAPPDLKSAEIARRKQKKKEAEEGRDKALDEGDLETAKKLNKRAVKVTPEINEEAKKLLRLMGVPVIQAPCEAEAQCAALCKAGKVWGTGSEDMDSLACGTPVLIRRLTFSEARKEPIMEIHLDRVLKGLDLTMEQFIDLCILLGSDYSEKIRGIGPKRAFEFIKKYGSIEKIFENMDKDKFKIPDNFPYEDIRKYFKDPPSSPAAECELTFNDPDEDGLIQFLCKEKGFNEDRVKNGIAKIRQSKGKAVQSRLTSFFVAKPESPDSKPKATVKSPAKSSPAKGSKKRKLDTTTSSPAGNKAKKQKK
eukprot:TRINITY_DN6628_c0_g1_i2.p1 TRINITY_DN6628_c0_g1~~TRINITY_DN6628_c0_g1_i2.p1  ORF type:complete len:403 (+),score=103.78 TRINITY_DN6628_c0_g1_i2:169-1209(+)